MNAKLRLILIAIAGVALARAVPALADNPFDTAGRQLNRAVAMPQMELDVTTVTNGFTTIRYKGKSVFSGTTSGRVSARKLSMNGVDYAAAWDAERVIWESAPGAADRVGAGPVDATDSTARLLKIKSPEARIRTSMVDGKAQVFFNDREVFVGPTSGAVSACSKVINGTAFAAAWDGERLLWENVPGAAAQFK